LVVHHLEVRLLAAERHSLSYFRGIYLALIMLGVLAFMVAGSTMGYIAYQYVTREEIRNPVHRNVGQEEEHASLYVVATHI
jgi:hypothetical protein